LSLIDVFKIDHIGEVNMVNYMIM